MSSQTKKPDQNWKVSWDTLQWVNKECHRLTGILGRKYVQREFGDMIRENYALLSRTPSTSRHTRVSISSVSNHSFLTGDTGDTVSLLTPDRRDLYHQWLDEILDSGIHNFVVGIVANLEWGSTATKLRGKEIDTARKGSGDSVAAASGATSGNADAIRKTDEKIGAIQDAVDAEKTNKRGTGKHPRRTA